MFLTAVGYGAVDTMWVDSTDYDVLNEALAEIELGGIKSQEKLFPRPEGFGGLVITGLPLVPLCNLESINTKGLP